MMGNIHTRLMLFYFIVASAWVKMYVVYKTQFNIKTEAWTQEFLLFINPLSSIIFLLAFSLFFVGRKRDNILLGISIFIAFVLYANIVYYRFFNDFITIPVLFQTSNMGDLGNSILALINFYDILFFSDVIILAFLIIKKKIGLKYANMQDAWSMFTVAVCLFIINVGLAETERPELLTRTFDREMLVKNIGTYNYHLYDIVLQSKSKAQRVFADSSEMVDIENFVKGNQSPLNKELFGIAKGRNVILISMESTQSFVINETINGKEITPFINELIKDSFYFPHFYHQTGQGKTSDGEFLVDNSLFGLPSGAVYFTHSQNEFYATPEILKEKGYYNAAFHANGKSFWNRDIMYETLGYDKFFSERYYDINEENSVGWGMKDMEFFDQSMSLLKSIPQPFYAKFLTLTNHHPFQLDDEDQYVDRFNSGDSTFDNYFPTVRYTDEALKLFFEQLKQEGLYENSMIVIYGDHYGISPHHNEAMAKWFEKEITPFETVQLQRVPFIIHIPGFEGHKTVNTVGGQVDVKPTLLHLLGVDTSNDIMLGNDLLSENRHSFAVLRDGSFITDEFVYTASNCYRKSDGVVIGDENCELVKEKARLQLEYSDQIIYGDLLRFFIEKFNKMK
jgi:lipoteichoic acid synthase